MQSAKKKSRGLESICMLSISVGMAICKVATAQHRKSSLYTNSYISKIR